MEEEDRVEPRSLPKFAAHLVRISREDATLAEPIVEVTVEEPVSPWSGLVDERTLEKVILGHPEVAGERLLVLGSQLTEFEEDLDRLDVLAIDERGEIVLLELKVDEKYRVSDLQALAYAAAYANQEPRNFAETLRRSMTQRGEVTATLEEAKDRIARFVGKDFEDWEPSQYVRIKVIAPAFPTRVLATIRWLRELHGVHIEAIQVNLFESSPDSYYLTFERVLPLPDAAEFELTWRDRERRRRAENIGEEWDGKSFYFLFGDPARRSWEDGLRYGFVSAGGAPKWSDPLKQLFVGAQVYVHVPPRRYVAIGKVTEERRPIAKFTVELNGQRTPLLDCPLDQDAIGEDKNHLENRECCPRLFPGLHALGRAAHGSAQLGRGLWAGLCPARTGGRTPGL